MCSELSDLVPTERDSVRNLLGNDLTIDIGFSGAENVTIRNPEQTIVSGR